MSGRWMSKVIASGKYRRASASPSCPLVATMARKPRSRARPPAARQPKALSARAGGGHGRSRARLRAPRGCAAARLVRCLRHGRGRRGHARRLCRSLGWQRHLRSLRCGRSHRLRPLDLGRRCLHLNGPATHRRRTRARPFAAAAQRDGHCRFRRGLVARKPAARGQHEGGSNDDVGGKRHGNHPLKSGRLVHPVAQDVADLYHRSPGCFVTMPTFWTPAALSRSNTSISS